MKVPVTAGRSALSLRLPMLSTMVACMSLLSAIELNHLSAAERLTLIDQIWASLCDDQVPVTLAQQIELRRRMASFDTDMAQAQSWDEVKAELEVLVP